MTVFPLRSIFRVCASASLAICAVLPTATMRPSLIASACAIVKRSSTVMIFPVDENRVYGLRSVRRRQKHKSCTAKDAKEPPHEYRFIDLNEIHFAPDNVARARPHPHLSPRGRRAFLPSPLGRAKRGAGTEGEGAVSPSSQCPTNPSACESRARCVRRTGSCCPRADPPTAAARAGW